MTITQLQEQIDEFAKQKGFFTSTLNLLSINYLEKRYNNHFSISLTLQGRDKSPTELNISANDPETLLQRMKMQYKVFTTTAKHPTQIDLK